MCGEWNLPERNVKKGAPGEQASAAGRLQSGCGIIGNCDGIEKPGLQKEGQPAGEGDGKAAR
ncbi:hypothetical protein GTO91_11940 [Heliobacterium undosum]|uniref:Uncharacterized protein n=1 Tax=Heliomicrobium undosum TaxID=121734 RepID=A0A845L6G5_9FIRM|nr:hypothetical protein [Heliomicrobium undosum]MZP30424.1 hypothetical protein [Heliomicrobium undosum]